MNKIVLLNNLDDSKLAMHNAKFGNLQRKVTDKLEIEGAPLIHSLYSAVMNDEGGEKDMTALVTLIDGIRGSTDYMPSSSSVSTISGWKLDMQQRIRKMEDPPWYWIGYWLCITNYQNSINKHKAFVYDHIGQLMDEMKKHKNKIETIQKSLKICESYMKQTQCRELPGDGVAVATHTQAKLALGTVSTMVDFDVRFDLVT